MSRSRLTADHVSRLLGDWRVPGTPDYKALARSLASLVDGARLPAGSLMPSQRSLALALGTARGTVARACEQLYDTGRLESRQGSGSTVRSRLGFRGADGRMLTFSQHSTPLDFSSGAMPGSRLVAEVMPEVGEPLRDHYLGASGYWPAGLPELRDMLAGRYRWAGIPTTAEQVLVTSGAQQAGWLIASLFAGPGSLTAVENPTYRGTLEVFTGAGGQVRGVPVLASGPDTDVLEAVSSHAHVFYTTAALHNPTGLHYPRGLRTRLAEIAQKHGVLVVDDHSQADLPWYRTTPLTGMETVMDADSILMVGTLSKLFWGGIRIGWIRGREPLIRQLAGVKSAVDLGTSVPDQLAALLLLPRAEEVMRSRRDQLASAYEQTASAIHEVFPRWRFTPPAGGSSIWVDTGTDTTRLAQAALRQDIRLSPGPLFSCEGGCKTFLRFPVWHDGSDMRDVLTTLRALT